MKFNTKRWARRLRRPKTWSVGTRRLFSVGLLIAIPLWLLAMLVVGVLGAVQSIVGSIASYWNAAPRPREVRSYGHLAHGTYRSPVRSLEAALIKRDAA